MKPTILILLAALAVSGCDNNTHYLNTIKIISKPENGYQKYEYYDGINWLYFYAPTGTYHIGQKITNDTIK